MAGLLDLPLEITQMIAVDIEDDADLLNFRLTCSHFNSAADDDQVTFWRSRFLTRYDPPAKPSKFTFKKRYIQRLNGLKLHLGPQKKAKLSLGPASVAVIRDLIAESFTPSKSNQYTFSKNMALVHDLMHRHGLFDGKTKMPKQKRGDSPKKPDFLLHAVQLTLTHVYLKSHTLSAGGVHMDFPTSQQMAYASAASQPIFDNTGCVNMEWTLHVAHFFRYYFLKPTEQLAGYFADLSPSERPQCWSEALRGGPQVLGKQWLGSYTYLDRRDLYLARAGDNIEEPLQDQTIDDDDIFQSLCLEFPVGKSHKWPDDWERILRSRSTPMIRGRTRAQKRETGPDGPPAGDALSFRFGGTGLDADASFLAAGWLNALPPQHGISGWQRLTMMKYYVEDGHDTTDPAAALPDSIWAYEGVVLPGGKIILGRWWHPLHGDDEEMYSGPFILWNVDTPKLELE